METVRAALRPGQLPAGSLYNRGAEEAVMRNLGFLVLLDGGHVFGQMKKAGPAAPPPSADEFAPT